MKLDLDPRARLLDGDRTLIGGDPWRVLRLTEGGAATIRGLLAGDAQGAEADALARRLIEAGLAHPPPARAPTREVSVVIPVRDRAGELERCLEALFAAGMPGRVIVVDDGSRDADAVAAVCADSGCERIRLERSRGPGAARNAALGRIDSGLVALLDSDCVPEPGWLSLLCGALAADPGLGAVAARVRPLGGHEVGEAGSSHVRAGTGRARGALSRFAAVRSPLDLGPFPSLVRPGGRTGYVPTAALLARREALGDPAEPFDPALRYGEDVDLVWRMIDRGRPIRYEPAAVVRHREPERLAPWLARRLRYGTSAGPLARRHPERLAPLVLHSRSVAALGAAAVVVGVRGAPSQAAALPIALHVCLTGRALARHGVPPRAATGLALRGLGESGAALGRAATMFAGAPLIAALARPRTRPAALALLLAGPVRDLVRLRPALDPLRFTALALADDLAYGAGVWTGSLRARTWRPLRPRIVRSPRRGSSDGG